MSVFAAAMDRIFNHTAMAVPALWISAATSEERTIRIIARAPDRVTEFGAGRFVSDSMMVDVRVAVRAGFEFDVPVRFDSDTLDVILDIERLGSITSIPLVEIRR